MQEPESPQTPTVDNLTDNPPAENLGSPPADISTPPSTSPATEEPATPVENVLSEQPVKGPAWFSVFIGFLIVVTLGIYGFLGYLYIQNSQLKKEIADKNAPTQGALTEISPTATPTPEVSPVELKIENGSVIQVISEDEIKVLLNKKDYPSTGITGFAKVTASPDYKKMCIESWPPAPEPSLYLANIDGSGLTEVSPNRKSCFWTHDSKSLVYLNTQLDTSPVDIYLYFLASAKEQNLTQDTAAQGSTRVYAVESISTDDSKIMCSYTQTASAEVAPSQGNCEIDLATLKLTEL